jgi:hypothetical protein
VTTAAVAGPLAHDGWATSWSGLETADETAWLG